jgi:hypothetical protein
LAAAFGAPWLRRRFPIPGFVDSSFYNWESGVEAKALQSFAFIHAKLNAIGVETPG